MDRQHDGRDDGPDVLEGWSCDPIPVFDSRRPYDLDALHARLRAVMTIGPSIAAHLVARAGGTPVYAESLLLDVYRELGRRGGLGLDADELEFVIFQLRMLLVIPTRDAGLEEQVVQEGIDARDILEGWSFERQPKFDTKASYDLKVREARVDTITLMGKSIAGHLTGRPGTRKSEEPASLMHGVWHSLNGRSWLGLNKDEAGILMFQLQFLLAASVI